MRVRSPWIVNHMLIHRHTITYTHTHTLTHVHTDEPPISSRQATGDKLQQCPGSLQLPQLPVLEGDAIALGNFI